MQPLNPFPEGISELEPRENDCLLETPSSTRRPLSDNLLEIQLEKGLSERHGLYLQTSATEQRKKTLVASSCDAFIRQI